MSASLVGSEMCIRDRSWGVAQRPLRSLGLRATGSGHAQQRPGCGRGRGTVSYTHLTLPTICSV
eukprot:10426518-Alexandrium_andersonii.AAC.1